LEKEMTRVTIQIPKTVNDFVEKVAALEGSTPEAWYQHWIGQAFDAIAVDNFTVPLDAEKMKTLYQVS
jgi:hypothetical protein